MQQFESADLSLQACNFNYGVINCVFICRNKQAVSQKYILVSCLSATCFTLSHLLNTIRCNLVKSGRVFKHPAQINREYFKYFTLRMNVSVKLHFHGKYESLGRGSIFRFSYLRTSRQTAAKFPSYDFATQFSTQCYFTMLHFSYRYKLPSYADNYWVGN